MYRTTTASTPLHSLSEDRQQILHVVGVVALHHSDEQTVGVERPLEDRLQEAVRCNLYDDGAGGNVLERLLEEDRADEVVDVIVGRRVPRQVRVPARLRDGAADPAGRPRSVLLDHLGENDNERLRRRQQSITSASNRTER